MKVSIQFTLTNFYRKYFDEFSWKRGKYGIFIDFTLHIHAPVADVNNPTHKDSIII